MRNDQMTYPMNLEAQQPRRRSAGIVLPILVGCCAFAIGGTVTFGYAQWQSQKQQLALMSQMVQQMQQQPAPAPAPLPEVTRNAPLDLLGTGAVAQTAPAAPANAQPAPAPVEPQVIPAAVAVPAQDDSLGKSTVDRIRALVSRSSDPLVSAALAQDAARRETMSIAIQGVNELVEAAVAGQYALSTLDRNGQDGGGLGITFEGREEIQTELESLLASAAEAGMIAFNASVKGSDGSYDGKIILYDLVERALINGSDVERRTGAQMQREALALLGRDNATVAAPASDGQRYYTVEPGDSLAYLALQFYGNTKGYLRIYRANRDKLSSPEKIQIGQRLLIPEA